MYRLERKFLFNNKFESNIALTYLLKNYSFRKSFKPRDVYSIYLDTKNLDFLYDNIIGLSNRKKIRYRFYSTIPNELIYEEKIKKNSFGKKIKKVYRNPEKLDIFKAKKIIKEIESEKKDILYQQISVNYKREYFIDIFKNSLTIDSDINFFDKRNYIYDRSLIEYKINLDNYKNNYFHKINFPFSRHSKYVAGMAMINKTIYV